MVALVSKTGEDGTWEQVASVDAPRADEQSSYDGAAFFDLQGTIGRYVRLEIDTGGEGVRMGEVKVFGWPVEAAF